MTVIQWGNFANGTIGSEFNDTSQNWNSSHVVIQSGAGPNGGNAALVTAHDTDQLFGDSAHARVHALSFSGGLPSWFNNGHEVWMGLSIKVPAGYTNSEPVFAGPEIHGDNGTGSAPFNISFQKGTGRTWQFIVRGSTYPTANPPGGYPFAQTVFGADPDHSTSEGTYFRHQQDWAGGNKVIVLGQWAHFRCGWFLSTTNAAGWFEGWYRDQTLDHWVNVVPRIALATSDPDTDGNGSAVYPVLSLYYNTGSGGQNAVIYGAGAWSDSATGLAAWQDTRLGFDTAGTTNTALPTITGTPQQGNTLTGVAGTWTGTPTLTYQWQWDQGTGAWGNVGGATSLSFVCSSTFTGSQVRLVETANGTQSVNSLPVTILGPTGSVFRLPLPGNRTGGSRTNSPGSRNPGAGGI